MATDDIKAYVAKAPSNLTSFVADTAANATAQPTTTEDTTGQTASTTASTTTSPEPQPTKAISMTDYANQIMDARAQKQAANTQLASQLSSANTTSGTINREDLNAGALGNQDPLSSEARSKLNAYESLITSQPSQYDPMRYAEAESISRSRIDPVYQQQVEQALKDASRNAVKSGFFGQIPAEQMKQNALASIEAQRTSDTYNSALDLMNKSNADRLQAYQAKYQAYRDQVGDVANDYQITKDAYDSDYTKWLQNEQFKWDKDYQQQTLDLDKWYKQQEVALEKQKQEYDQRIAVAQLTGDWEGQRTLEGQRLDLEKQQAALQAQYQQAQINVLNASLSKTSSSGSTAKSTSTTTTAPKTTVVTSPSYGNTSESANANVTYR